MSAWEPVGYHTVIRSDTTHSLPVKVLVPVDRDSWRLNDDEYDTLRQECAARVASALNRDETDIRVPRDLAAELVAAIEEDPASRKDIHRCETLRAAAKILAELRDDDTNWSPSGIRDINAMIDRCNLAAIGVDGNDSRSTVPSLLPDPRDVLADHGWHEVSGNAWTHGESGATAVIDRGALTPRGSYSMGPDILRAFAALAEETQP